MADTQNNTEEGVFEIVRRYTWRLLGAFFLVFFVTLSLLLALGLVPESIVSPAGSLGDNQSASVASVERERAVVEPERIVIASIGVDAEVVNPQSRDVTVLDKALKDGVVHFPGSGGLDDETNMFLFGHSSFLPVVYNRNYQLFNNLEEVKRNDIISVYGGGREYRYVVTRVFLDEAAAIRVSLGEGKKMLTLSTCNSFGKEGERFVVEADFVGSYPVSTAVELG